MRSAQLSLSEFLGVVALCAAGLMCLMFASSPWVSALFSAVLGLLTLALLGVTYRRGERRAFWAGFALFGWTYLTLSSGPWFIVNLRPDLVTSKLISMAYPWLIPEARQPSSPASQRQQFVLPSATLQDGLTADKLVGSRVDVLVKGERDPSPVLVVTDVQAVADPEIVDTLPGTRLDIRRDQNAILAQAKAGQKKFFLRRHTPVPFEPLWSSPPVDLPAFENVGHSLFALLFAWVGSAAGRYFFATRGHEDTGGTPA
ncbi:MAG: hypothetical protein ACLQIB_52230 [Isosphaeraceae bacterium]